LTNIEASLAQSSLLDRKDLVAGSDLEFEEHETAGLNDIPGRWHLHRSTM
jgi:hypothetical protein